MFTSNDAENMTHQRTFLSHALIYVLSLALGYTLGFALSSDDKTTFRMVGAWWLALYVGRVANIRAATIFPVAVLYSTVVIIDISLNQGWFYLDGSAADSLNYFDLSLIGLAIVVSPLAVNGIIRLAPRH